jgi:hypothetical protein
VNSLFSAIIAYLITLLVTKIVFIQNSHISPQSSFRTGKRDICRKTMQELKAIRLERKRKYLQNGNSSWNKYTRENEDETEMDQSFLLRIWNLNGITLWNGNNIAKMVDGECLQLTFSSPAASAATIQ